MFLKFWEVQLVMVWLVIAGSVLAMAALYQNGRLSSDSTTYLQLAENIVQGDGLYLKDFFSPTGRSYFGRWPVGYPILIASAARGVHLDVFWAAKLINLAMVGVILIIFRQIFREKSVGYALVLLTATPLNIWSMTWSEVPFMAGLVMLAVTLERVTHTALWRWTFVCTITALWLFLMRYIGLFVLPLLLLLAMVSAVQRRWRLAAQFFMSGVVLGIGAGLYLWHNHVRTGFWAGREHVETVSAPVSLLKHFLRAVFNEFNLWFDGPTGLWPLVGAMVALFFLLKLLRKHAVITRDDVHRSDQQPRWWLYFGGIGLAHLAAMTAWFVYLGDLDSRLLGPSSLLGLLATVSWLQRTISYRYLQWVLMGIVLVAWIVNIPGKLVYTTILQGQTPYGTYAAKTLRRYQDVPADSLVLMADPLIRFLRTDIQAVYISPEDLHLPASELVKQPDKLMFAYQRACQTWARKLYLDSDIALAEKVELESLAKLAHLTITLGKLLEVPKDFCRTH